MYNYLIVMLPRDRSVSRISVEKPYTRLQPNNTVSHLVLLYLSVTNIAWLLRVFIKHVGLLLLTSSGARKQAPSVHTKGDIYE